MVDNELLLLAAAFVLVFALPLGLLAWMAAQYAQMRLLAHRLEGLEVSVSRLREQGSAGAAQHVATSSETASSDSDDPGVLATDDDELSPSPDVGRAS